VQVGILGPLVVSDDTGASLEVAGARLRALLARLALDAGRPVSAATLVDAVWGDDRPAEAGNALQTLVSRLRRTLGDASSIGQSAAGYRLALDPNDVDAHRFETLARSGAQALRADDPAEAAALLQEAVGLWRGPALADAGLPVDTAAGRLEQLRVDASVDLATAQLQLGAPEGALAELETLADEHRLDERIATALVTALAAAGRQADALLAYERTRTLLTDELGVDPSPELQAAHLAVLRGTVHAARCRGGRTCARS
jgi:DNA-binding SARP family transcriptional activator